MSKSKLGNNFAGIYRDPISNLIGTERTVLINIIIDCKFNDDPDFALRDGTPIPLKRGQIELHPFVRPLPL